MALYFEEQSETYEFLVKSDANIKGNLIRILDEYKRKKDEFRMNNAKNSFLDRLQLYAEEKRRKNFAFLEEFDNGVTVEMLRIWLKMSKSFEMQRKKLQKAEKIEPAEENFDEENEAEKRRLLEENMRKFQEEELLKQEQVFYEKKTRILVNSIQKNQAFLDCNRFQLNRFIKEWRKMALFNYNKQKELEISSKIRPESKGIYIKVIEITQNTIDMPVFSMKMRIPALNQQKPAFKAISSKEKKGNSAMNSEGVYHEIQYSLRVSGQEKAVKFFENSKENKQKAQILWELKPESNIISWNLGINSRDSNNFSTKDLLEFSLLNEDPRENSSVLKSTMIIADFLKETEPLKIYYLLLNSSENDDKNHNISAMVKFKVFLGDSSPNEADWELDLIKTIKIQHFINDPVYKEMIKLPKYTPKNLGFLIEILTEWGLFDIEMKYKRLTGGFQCKKLKKNREENEEENEENPKKNKELLQEVIEVLYGFIIEETSKSYAKSQGNIKKFIRFEETISDFFKKQKPLLAEELEIQENSDESDENYNENYHEKSFKNSRIFQLRSRNPTKLDKKSLDSLEEMCRKGGIPNEKRPFLWSFLANIEEIKVKAVTFYNSSQKIQSYNNNKRPLAGEDQEISLSNFYLKLLQMSQNSEVCHLISQQIADDIDLTNEIEDFSNEKMQEPLTNILSAFSFLIDMLKSSNPQHLDPYKHIFYSLPILKIARKVLSLLNVKNLDSDQMNLKAFKGEENSESPLKNKPYSSRTSNIANPLNNSNEFLAFWMLVSMISHILPGYFIGMPHELNKEIKTPLRESYQDEIGLKRDLLILKFFIKEHEPAIFQLFEDISLPLEFFYGNMLLSAGADIINKEILYRIWDLMFLQKEKDQDPHLILISLIIFILKISKPHILKNSNIAKETKNTTKDSKEINDILKIFETMSRFLPNPDDTIEEIYKIHENLTRFLRQEYGKFNALRNELNSAFQNIRHQNKMVYDLIHHKNNFEDLKENVGVFELFKLLETLKKRHKLFLSSYKEESELAVPEEFEPNDDPQLKKMNALNEKLQWFRHFDAKNDANMIIHIYLHRLTLFESREEQAFKLKVLYQNEIVSNLPLEFNTSCYVNHYLQIPYNKKGSHDIVIRIMKEIEREIPNKSAANTANLSRNSEIQPMKLEKMEKMEIIVKETTINLDSLFVNYLQKGIAKLDVSQVSELSLNKRDYNLTTSELEYSIVLSTDEKQEYNESSFRNNAKILAQALPKPLFKVETFEKIKEVNLEKFHEKFLKTLINVLGLSHISNASFAINPNEWRKNSKITYEEFRNTLKEAKFIEGVPLDYFALYNAIMNANRDKTFYFSDFLILLIIFSHTTPKQKALLFYDVLLLFDNTRDLCNGVSIITVKSMIGYLYEVFMLSIPHHQIDNIIEFLNDGFVSGVLSAKLDYKTADKSAMTMDFTNTLIHISNYLHYYYNTKQIFLGDPQKLTLLKEVLENLNQETSEIMDFLPANELLKLNVKYRIKGLKHKLQILFDKSWEIKRKLVLDPEVHELNIQTPERYKLVETLLLQNENVIPLGNMDSFLTKNQFILLFEKLPLMNYFLSFSILENNEVRLPQISCSIRLENELIGHIDNLYNKNLAPISDFEENNRKYRNLSYEWSQKRQEILNKRNKNYVSKPSSLSFDRFPYYESFFNTIRLIQEKIMSNFLQEEVYVPASSMINSRMSNSGLKQTGRKAPEYSRIFDIDFRKTTFEMFCMDPVVSGLFHCSLFDLAWIVSSNLRGLNSQELKLVIKYFPTKSNEKTAIRPRKPDIVIYDPFKRSEQKFQCMAVFYYSYQSKEWLACKVIKRYFSVTKKQSKRNKECSYYGVIFQAEPESIFINY